MVARHAFRHLHHHETANMSVPYQMGRRRDPIRAAHTSPPTTLSRNRGQERVRQTYTDVPRTSEAPASPYATPLGQYPRCEHTGRSRFEPQNGVNALLPTTMPSRRTRTRSRWSRVGKWSGMANPLIAGDLAPCAPSESSCARRNRPKSLTRSMGRENGPGRPRRSRTRRGAAFVRVVISCRAGTPKAAVGESIWASPQPHLRTANHTSAQRTARQSSVFALHPHFRGSKWIRSISQSRRALKALRREL